MVVTNFGLLLPDEGASGRWQAVCDDLYGTARPELVRTDGRGRLFAAAESGLWSTADGCAFARSAGAVADSPVHDLAFDPQPSGRILALAGEQRVLAVSTDGGATFQVAHRFVDAHPYSRLLVAPSNSQRIYVVAGGQAASTIQTILSSSADGGATWITRDLAEGLVPAPQNTFTFMAIAPDNPEVLFFSLVDAYGDELWRSEDGGRSLKRVLKGGPRDWLTGLAFGPDARTVYAAAAVVPVIDMEPPGHLFISRDGGTSWAEPILADRTGPDRATGAFMPPRGSCTPAAWASRAARRFWSGLQSTRARAGRPWPACRISRASRAACAHPALRPRPGCATVTTGADPPRPRSRHQLLRATRLP